MKGLTLILVVVFLVVLLVIISKIQTVRESFESETKEEDAYFDKIITDKQNDWNKYVNQLFCAILCPIKYDKNVHLMWIVDLEKKNNTIYKMLNYLKLQFS